MGGGERGPYNLENNEEKDENGTTTAETNEIATRTRIFVGDLGLNVKAEDLVNTFAGLGKVESVEIVRNQGRSFAYFDFLPSSIKSLSKLFSTYNGCKWKGGRLRIEKAKEHYLLRLGKEWAEDATFTNCKPSNTVTRKTASPEELNNMLNSEKREFRLFFPKLKKVKELPFKGTGKHKYSFQRVEVPPLPVHFCDCEEHSDPSYTAKGKDPSNPEAQGGGLDKKELDMMKSVMNKFLGEDFIPKATSGGAKFVKGGDNAKPVDDLVRDENEMDDIPDNVTRSLDNLVACEKEMDTTTDEDDLILNVVAGGKQRTPSSGKQRREVNLSKELQGKIIGDQLQASEDRPSEHVLKSRGSKVVASDKKRKSPLTEEARGNKLGSANLAGRKGSTKKPHLLQVAHSIELESATQPKNTNSGSKKFAWGDLAGGRGNNSFSISDIVQNPVPEREESKSDGYNVYEITDCQNENTEKNINLESQSSHIEKTGELAVAQPNKCYPGLNDYARGASWLQKSSWTQLVSEKNSSFSISQLLPVSSLGKQKQVELKSTLNSTESTHCKLVKASSSASAEDSSIVLGVGDKGVVTALGSSNYIVSDTVALDPEPILPKNQQTFGETDEVTAPKKNDVVAEELSVRNLMSEGTCSFMRSGASMKEWAKAKAALSGSLKKQNKKQPI